ncbi:Gfo/Idh/MocA family oxidoreductase [Patescibacteria group bacterium]|nr:Gfo/Idh/MocA family oxidoreductase [Patescibacteria group bacterium]
MRLLIQGCGSIGQRHYKNAVLLGHDAAFLRESESRRPFVQKFFDEEQQLGRSVPKVFTSMQDAIESWKPDALIIATPNNMHLSNAKLGASNNLPMLIEKPVAISEDGLRDLVEEVESRGIVTMVGYNLRFHPLLQRIKDMVDTKYLGTVLSVDVEVGENIADWHPWEDYSETYAPYIASGGGSLLCFSHDIDYVYWLFGAPSSVEAVGGKLTPLEGDAEDMVKTLWRFDDGLVASLHIDYFQRPKVRTLKIIGTNKIIEWDAYGSLIVWDQITSQKEEITVPEGFERNDMFKEELAHFIRAVEKGTQTNIPLSQGCTVVNIVERIKGRLK